MCNLYAQTNDTKKIKNHFGLSDNRMERVKPQSAIFPNNSAPIIRPTCDGDLELVHLTWGFQLPQKDKAPKAVTNMRDDKALTSPFWNSSLETRRCLVPATSFCEPKGSKPATWHWFALQDDTEVRPPFAFAGVWCDSTYAFATTTPNNLVKQIHPTRMPVLLKSQEAQTLWLEGNTQDALSMLRQIPSSMMKIVQSGSAREDLLNKADQTP